MTDANPASFEFGALEERCRVTHHIRQMLVEEPYCSARAGALQELYRRLGYVEARRS